MTIKAGYFTPMLHAAEIEQSIRFYELLGFSTMMTDGCNPIGWARLHCEGGALMFLRAEHTIDPSCQGVMLYMYTPDLAGLREQLLAENIAVPPIKHPHYMPSGEVLMPDPDGYLVGICHWGKAEQEGWEKPLEEKA